ncbi:MAG: adenylyltransferase/cytidyltransferase family protein [Lachnospiraceae bacterium]|nr:adenylyltransferase/cytidyltransferase family protein [Lachnospiraceae bacterium]
MAAEFLNTLRNEQELRTFHEKYRRNYQNVHTNRQRLNYSADEYERLFVNIFDGLERKKVILFGSGVFAKKFLELYGSEYTISAVLDNNSEKWGTCFYGIEIQSPDVLKELDKDEYKVIICIKNYLGVIRQLQGLGVKHLGIYDTNKSYKQNIKREQRVICKQNAEVKKYQTGYIAGVFDLFHIGHLNMFKRAKEQCEYLIVGVVSDDGVKKHKKVEPFIPFEERIEMVRSCRYVDEAVEIPLNYGGTRDAYRLYHFDVQFSGSDYAKDPNWLADQEYLRRHGSDIVFFPYTEQTSSTKIKALIEKKLS